MTYLITFAIYGRRLRASESGFVDREHNVRGAPILEVDSARAAAGRERMDQAPYNLDEIRRDVVMEAIQEVHARSNHVHTIVDGEVPPERVMSDFKAYASRHLNLITLNEPGQKRWATPWQYTKVVGTAARPGGE